jgi:DNA polymerase III subunit epsilon
VRFLLNQPFGTFDLETTGVDVETARIVTACHALLQPAEPVWRQRIDSWLVAVEEDIPAEATAVHGITTAWAQEHGDPPEKVVGSIIDRINETLQAGFPVVVMNGAYDFTVLDREARRFDHWASDTPGDFHVVDVYVIDKWLDPYRPGGRKLEQLCGWYQVTHGGAHDSTSDALAAARVAYRIARWCQRVRTDQADRAAFVEFLRSHDRGQPQEIVDKLLMLGDMGARQLHQNQVRWRREQQVSLRKYLVRKGEPNPDCDPHWPVKPYTRTYDEEVPAHGDV